MLPRKVVIVMFKEERFINDRETMLTFDHDLKLKIQFDNRGNIHWRLLGKASSNGLNEYIIFVDNKSYLYAVLMELFEDFRLGRIFNGSEYPYLNNNLLNQRRDIRQTVKSIYSKKLNEEQLLWYSDGNNDYLCISLKDGKITIINQSDNLLLKPDILFITNGNSEYGYGYLPFKRAFEKLNINIKQKIKRL